MVLAQTTVQLRAATRRAERALPDGADGADVHATERSLAWTTLGVGRFWLGETDAAEDALARAQEVAGRTRHQPLRNLVGGLRAMLAATRSRLRDARELADTAIRDNGGPDGFTLGPAHAALCLVELEHDNLPAAVIHAQHVTASAGAQEYAPMQALRRMSVAAVALAADDPEGALAALDGPAEPPLLVWPMGLVRARALTLTGRRTEAVAAVRALPPTLSSVVFEAALRRQAGDPKSALALLARLPGGVPLRARVEREVISALALLDLDDEPAAREALERALDVAEPEGLRRPFVIHGPALIALVDRHLMRGTGHRTFAAEIVAGAGVPTTARGDDASRADELSPRELAVLRYLPTAMTSAEIAGELFVSANTVRTHVKHVYEKLDAHTRTDAVNRARRLGLLAPPRLTRPVRG
jgi:LuxR family maltose regulon positive regulatory protein